MPPHAGGGGIRQLGMMAMPLVAGGGTKRPSSRWTRHKAGFTASKRPLSSLLARRVSTQSRYYPPLRHAVFPEPDARVLPGFPSSTVVYYLHETAPKSLIGVGSHCTHWPCRGYPRH